MQHTSFITHRDYLQICSANQMLGNEQNLSNNTRTCSWSQFPRMPVPSMARAARGFNHSRHQGTWISLRFYMFRSYVFICIYNYNVEEFSKFKHNVRKNNRLLFSWKTSGYCFPEKLTIEMWFKWLHRFNNFRDTIGGSTHTKFHLHGCVHDDKHILHHIWGFKFWS
jgi:hypothetical protein